MDLTEQKQFPQNYSSDAVRVLRAMSLTEGKELQLVGSMALRSQLYAGDFDAFEDVRSDDERSRALDRFARLFQDSVKELRSLPNTYIADIKVGVVEDWQVIPANAGIVGGAIRNFNLVAARGRVERLVLQRVMTPAEGTEAMTLLKDSMTPEQFLVAKDTIKPHIMRWRPADVLAGYVVLRTGKRVTLQEAFTTPGVAKMDVISWMNGNHFAEFSCIYNFYVNGKWINAIPVNPKQGLQEDIVSLMADGKPFKAMKRRFALAKLENDTGTMRRLQPILNGDLGRIYSLRSDIDTLLYMLENYQNFPDKEVDFELDQFRDRFSNIYGIKEFIYAEPAMLGKLEAAIRAPRSSRGRAIMTKHLTDVQEHLQQILAEHTPKNV